jgi:hypothetical protein
MRMNFKERGLAIFACVFVFTFFVSIGIVSASVWVSIPSYDSWVDSWHQNDINGNSNHLRGGYDFNDTAFQEFITFIKFDLDSVLSDVTINGAKLSLYLDRGADSARMHGVGRVLEYWDEDNVNWSDLPLFTGVYVDEQLVGFEEDVWVEWDVTEDVLGFVNGDFENYGWAVEDGTPDPIYDGSWDFEVWYRSKEYDVENLRPKLTVYYDLGPFGFSDLLQLLTNWGSCSDDEGDSCLYDIDSDGDIDNWDMRLLLGAWG